MKTLATEYTVRRLRAEDAEGVVDCVRRVYGDSYIIHTELYHPEEIVALNEVGRLVSVVALDDGGEIVGHYALERPDPSFRIAESGEAMVLPQHQHHHLLEKMRLLLEEEAGRLGLTGIFGRTVTNHLFSLKDGRAVRRTTVRREPRSNATHVPEHARSALATNERRLLF